ncbi:Phosphoacetylglucosamine mutase [Mycena chlorophos]|uniref:Phosphoacetylglucosamine mutase n=1 Tax=Mycena chlorophos TaxID=658473 RepID=A0A8H6T602_MYCCL|nr:Phosphoacetylglucosamine mutase [Mycena chlorophos]
MPVERSRYSRRGPTDGPSAHLLSKMGPHAEAGTEIVWTLPVEPVGESGIGFAPNLTEQAFSDTPPPLVDIPATPVSSFIFADESSFAGAPQETRRIHARKKSSGHVPRPPNAFILFRSSFIKSQQVSETVETNHSTLSKIIGMTWKNLSEDERTVWRQAAAEAVADHKRKFPTYSFRPKHSRGKKGDPERPPPKPKRKVREGSYKDPARCEKIAELLAKGTNGAELAAAIEEYDRHNKPQIVAQFQAPITARAYRRSSSVPAPNSEESRGFLAPSPASGGGSRRRRSSSVGAISIEQRARPRGPSMFVDTASAHKLYGSSLVQPKAEVLDEAFVGFLVCIDTSWLNNPQDFSSFSFSNVTSPTPSVGYDPLSMPMSPCSPLESTAFDPALEMPPSPADFSPVDSIDISALIANEWLMHGESGFGGYPVAPVTLPAFAFNPSPFSNPCDLGFKNLGLEEQASFCAAPDAMVGLAQLEAELASFVVQYSL